MYPYVPFTILPFADKKNKEAYNECSFLTLVIIVPLLLIQGTWVFIDAKKGGKILLVVGIFGLLNVPSALIIYLMITRIILRKSKIIVSKENESPNDDLYPTHDDCGPLLVYLSGPESNPGHEDYQSCALPTELSSQTLTWRQPTLPQGHPCSTIGALKLNLRVRYGNGCYLHAIITRLRII